MRVHQTTNYKKFKLVKENREVNQSHVTRLKKSIQKNDYGPAMPIFVTDDDEVVDGQHRLQARKELGLPIYFLKVGKHIGIDEIINLNTTQKKWMLKDFLNQYCRAGNKNYLRFKSLMDLSGYGFQENFALLKSSLAGGTFTGQFKKGTMKVSKQEHQNGIEKYHKLKGLERYRRKLNWRQFLLAVITCTNLKNFSVKRLEKMFEAKFYEIKKLTGTPANIMQILDFYNYGLSTKNEITIKDVKSVASENIRDNWNK